MTDRIRVVIADDAEDLRFLISMQLDLDGRFEVVGQTDDGEALLDLIDAADPDCLVLDLSMPRVSGLEVLPRIRAAHPDLPILVLSGYAIEEHEGLALELGATGYLQKGVGVSGLADVLADLVTEAG